MTAMASNWATGQNTAVAVPPPMDRRDIADEMNHRIANSLQLLIALMSVDMRGLADPAGRAALDMARQRIGAIAGIHRRLYRSPDAQSVDLAAYLEELGTDLEGGFGDLRDERRIVVSARGVIVSPDEASLIGILVCELVGNACKHAYAPGCAGDIRITLQRKPRGYRLEVEDRGLGLPAETERGEAGLGSRLIGVIASRLGATCRWEDARPGTRFVLVAGPV